MENHVRIFREKPFGWFDKPIMRYLREKYGRNKKQFLALRSVYLAVCEMESDFQNDPITSFNKTVGTYAGLTRQVAGKYIRILEQEGLLQKMRVMNPDTNLKSKGTYFRITSSQEFENTKREVLEERKEQKKTANTASLRVARYPTIRTSDHSDTSPDIKKISIRKKKKKNVKEKEEKGSEERIEYYANLIAEKLGDRKSLSYYKLACRMHNPETLYQKASAIVSDGGARNPAAVFVAWLKQEQRGTSPPKSDHPG
jgi:hypothetical protein